MIATEEFAISTESIGRLADIILSLQRCFIARLSATLADGQVSFPQFFLLTHINDAHEALSMTEIAGKMSHTTAAATGLVDRLERLAYVERAPAPHDRRKVLVRIKPKGVELVALIRRDMMESLSKVMRELTPHEQTMWIQIYEKVFRYCQAQAESCPPITEN